MSKIGMRVNTMYGEGTVVKTEGPYGNFSNPWYTYGIKLDNLPEKFKNGFKDDILYFYPREIKIVGAN